jgi:ABC-type phosphate/phosphonate transport system substrate-binding protein
MNHPKPKPEIRMRPKDRVSKVSWWRRNLASVFGQLGRAVVLGCAVALLSGSPGAEPASHPFRVGISYASFGTVSRNDASAALKAWASTVSRERKLALKVEVEVFESESDLYQALDHEQVDAASLTAEGFAHLQRKPETVFLTSKSQVFTEGYVLVVNGSSGIDDVSALKGHKVVRPESPRMSLAQPWLEVLLASRGLPRAGDFFGGFTPVENPSKAVLRVFFRQSDACVVTTNGFALVCELNPQLRKQLKVVAFSPAVVPNLFFFRPSYTARVRQELEAAIVDLHSTPSGLQLLTVFQGDQMTKQPRSCLETTGQLVAEFDRLCAAQNLGNPPLTEPAGHATATP